MKVKHSLFNGSQIINSNSNESQNLKKIQQIRTNLLYKSHYLLLVWVTDDIALATCTYQPTGMKLAKKMDFHPPMLYLLW